MDEIEKKKSRKRLDLAGKFMLVVILLLIFIEYSILSVNNQAKSYETSETLIEQVETLLTNNNDKEQSLVDSLKESYIAKAKAVAYMIDSMPEIEDDVSELVYIAELLSIDEIHLFDEEGVIYGGTVPLYYGYSFDSGEQISYFKPMLGNKALSMCQNVTPNTAEEKSMMYAICWDNSGEKMVQVGIEPERLLAEMRSNEISEVISGMPTYEGIEIMVANKDSLEIVGSTTGSQNGKLLDEVGLSCLMDEEPNHLKFNTSIEGKNYYCVADTHGGFILTVLQDKKSANKGINIVLLTLVIYLVIAAVVIMIIVVRMTENIIKEHMFANTDVLTGLLNRRAYEEDVIVRYRDNPFEENMVYIAFDLNGLKNTNDNFGHEAGDKLLKGASHCIRKSFGEYGKLYRIGGDEFAANIIVDEESAKDACSFFEDCMAMWTKKNDMKLVVSYGMVRASEFEDKSVSELVKAADDLMYEQKAKYYRENNIDRRRR